MSSLADALVYAVVYLSVSENDQDELDDRDVGALESIAGFLRSASASEHDALAAAAERALAVERSSASPRSDFVAAYASFMEELLGDPWEDNQRRT